MLVPRPGDVAIFTGPAWTPWAPPDLLTNGLGGSETAAVRLAEQLASQGYVVTVYGDCRAGSFGGAAYRNHATFDASERRQAVICSRVPALFDLPVNAEQTILWAHDCDFGDQLTPARADNIDHLVALSAWHRKHLAERYPFAASKLTQSRNGIFLPWFTDGEPPDRKRRVVYTSSPDRGLDILLELWPQIREQVPDAELVHSYAPVYDAIAEQRPDASAHRDKIRELASQPGVRRIGGLGQPQLALLLRSSMVWALPSWSTPARQRFPETSCIGAMEAQAAGCWVAAGAWGALPETVHIGRLVGRPGRGNSPSKSWGRRFVNAVVEGLTDPEAQASAAAAPERMQDLGWDGVGDQFAALCNGS